MTWRDRLDAERWEHHAAAEPDPEPLLPDWSAAARLAIRAVGGKDAQADSHTDAPTIESVADSDAPKLTTTTVTLPCPDCGEPISRDVRVGKPYSDGRRTLALELIFPPDEAHVCKPTQPDEPQGFSARVTLIHPSGLTLRWARQHDGYWASERGELLTWDRLCAQGTVTLGWGDDQ